MTDDRKFVDCTDFRAGAHLWECRYIVGDGYVVGDCMAEVQINADDYRAANYIATAIETALSNLSNNKIEMIGVSRVEPQEWTEGKE